MSAHAVAAKGETNGTVVLVCNEDGCDRRFTIGVFGAARTRVFAEKREGWQVGTREDRRDFCPEHVGATS